LSVLAIVIYFPVGLVLAVFRMFIGLQAFVAACVLPKTSLLRRFVSCGLLLLSQCTFIQFFDAVSWTAAREFSLDKTSCCNNNYDKL